MAKMIVFMNEECQASHQQIEDLKKAGNRICCKDLSFYNWSREELLPFLRGRDPLHFMDHSAPAIKNRSIDPLLLTFEEAVDLVLRSPDLLQGPLVQVDNLYIHGKNDTRLDRYLKASLSPLPQSRKNILPFRKRKSQPSKQSHGNSFHPFWGAYYACSASS